MGFSSKRLLRIFLLILVFFGHGLWAQQTEVIEVPEEELARETVLPVFDRVNAVKNRNVNMAGRFEVGGGLGMNLTEALYNNLNFNATFAYYFDELHGANLSYVHIFDGLSNMGGNLKDGKGIEPDTFDASLAPHPESMVFGNYQFNAYYGKISFSKQAVLNLSLYGLAGLGMVNFGDSSSPAVNVGVGQKMYFGPNFALRGDFRYVVYSGPDPTAEPLNAGTDSVKSSDLKDTTYSHIYLTISLVYLL